MAQVADTTQAHFTPHIRPAKGHNIMGTFILSQTPAQRNGTGQIPTSDNRILVKTTKQFYLRNHLVPAGSIGKVVDLVCDGQLYLVDFGLPIVARIEPGSQLIEPVNLAAEYADLQADVTRFEAGLTAFEAKINELRQRMEVQR